MKPSPLQEKNGDWSIRRLISLGCFANAIRLSWDIQAPWAFIAIFIGAGLLLLGICTMQELIELSHGEAKQ